MMMVVFLYYGLFYMYNTFLFYCISTYVGIYMTEDKSWGVLMALPELILPYTKAVFSTFWITIPCLSPIFWDVLIYKYGP